MMNAATTSTFLIAISLSLAASQAALAEAPTIQTNGPVIHLADNLGEEAMLGWCIDTEGRGVSDQLHAHSCKPTGDDVLFAYASDSSLIRSATYEGMCMAYNAPDSTENPFGLIACDDADPAQAFAYDEASMELRLGADASQCVTVSPTIDDAGPFQSRDLILAVCDELDPSFNSGSSEIDPIALRLMPGAASWGREPWPVQDVRRARPARRNSGLTVGLLPGIEEPAGVIAAFGDRPVRRRKLALLCERAPVAADPVGGLNRGG